MLVDQLGYPRGHDPSVEWNREHFAELKERCQANGRRITCGVWFNGWAGGKLPDSPEGGLGTTASQDAAAVASFVHEHDAGPVVLDLEAAYQFPGGDWNALPYLVAGVRKLLPTRGIGVSTNSPNDSMIWNGGPLGPAASMYRLSVRLLPQWYNAPAYGHSTWMRPDQTMAWLQAHGNEDNLYLLGGPGNRAVPLSYVHGTLEVSGLDGADLAGELAELEIAHAYHGYTAGFSVYTLEACPLADFELLASMRGRLFYA